MSASAESSRTSRRLERLELLADEAEQAERLLVGAAGPARPRRVEEEPGGEVPVLRRGRVGGEPHRKADDTALALARHRPVVLDGGEDARVQELALFLLEALVERALHEHVGELVGRRIVGVDLLLAKAG